MRAKGVIQAAIALAVLLLGGPLSAQVKVPVHLEVRDCPFLDDREVLRVIHAELRVELPKPGETTGVAAMCAGDRLKLEVLDPVSRKVLRRNFGLRNPSHSGLSRLVGIAAAELILASWAELAINPQPVVEPEGPPPDPAILRAARDRVRERAAAPPPLPAAQQETALTPLAPEPEDDAESERDDSPSLRQRFTERRLRLVVFASRRSFFAYPGELWGGGARLGAEPLPLLSWAADLSYESGELRSDRTYEVDSFTAGGQLFLCHRSDPFTLRIGGGLRAGFAASTPRDGGTGTRTVAPWGWPLATLNVSAAPHPTVVLELSAEASYSALPVSGARGDPPKGVWFATQAGIGFIP